MHADLYIFIYIHSFIHTNICSLRAPLQFVLHCIRHRLLLVLVVFEFHREGAKYAHNIALEAKHRPLLITDAPGSNQAR